GSDHGESDACVAAEQQVHDQQPICQYIFKQQQCVCGFDEPACRLANGDRQSFDLALLQANNDVGNLVIAPPLAPYQADNLESFKTNGLGIKSSADYDLSTAAGKAAAVADVQNAQSQVIQLSGIQTSNQILAFDIASALTTQINSINKTITE